jgi:hypothetical protein
MDRALTRRIEGVNSLVLHGSINQANETLLELAEEYGDEALGQAIRNQPISAIAPMISLGNGNDIPVVLGFLEPKQWAKSFLIAVSDFHEQLDACWNYDFQQHIINLLNQVLYADIEDEDKTAYLDKLFEIEAGHLAILALLVSCQENGHEPDSPRENNPYTVLETISSFGFSAQIEELWLGISRVNLHGLFKAIVSAVEELTGQKPDYAERNIFASREN